MTLHAKATVIVCAVRASCMRSMSELARQTCLGILAHANTSPDYAWTPDILNSHLLVCSMIPTHAMLHITWTAESGANTFESKKYSKELHDAPFL